MKIIARNPKFFRSANNLYFETGFITIIEDHLSLLKQSTDSTVIEITYVEANMWQSDFFGLLKYKNIPQKLWYATMRMTGLTAPSDLTRNLTALLVPSEGTIDDFADKYKRAKK